MRFEYRVKKWRTYIPIVEVLGDYRRGYLQRDLVAGLIVGLITVPQAMAYAFLAGLPAQTGLYACLVPMLIYTIFGSSRHLVVGPVAVAALMVAATIGQATERFGYPPTEIALILSLQVGLILWLLRLSQMGGLVNLLSHPVIGGFINAAAILIIFSQIPGLTGMPSKSGNPLDQAAWYLTHLTAVHWLPIVMGIASLAVIWFCQKHLVRQLRRMGVRLGFGHPISRIGPIAVLALSALAVWAGDLHVRFGLETVGYVPQGLPTLTVPKFDLRLWGSLLGSSAILAVVVYVESYSIASGFATREQSRINSHQELIALGASNIGAAFFGAYPVAGSFSRSSVNYDAGARTPISSVVSSLVVVLVLLLLTPLFAYLPAPALAAIVVLSVVNLLDFRGIGRHWRIYREDAITSVITMLTVLIAGVETGLLTGVGLSIAFFVRSSSRPEVTVLGRMGTSEHFRSVRRYDVRTVPHAACVRVDENIYFANANQIENKLLKAVHRRPGTSHLLLVCSAVNRIDVSGLEMLFRLNRALDRLGVKLSLAEVKASVMEQLDATNLKTVLTGKVYFTTDQGMRELEADAPDRPQQEGLPLI
ncbi:MAG: sulfate permease [Pseudomonadales bacterium]|nr:sulfate permease [Pseudomonadales bacterium]MCP5184408.1 sulfate permease [Pseudomonadales bacterium]